MQTQTQSHPLLSSNPNLYNNFKSAVADVLGYELNMNDQLHWVHVGENGKIDTFGVKYTTAAKAAEQYFDADGTYHCIIDESALEHYLFNFYNNPVDIFAGGVHTTYEKPITKMVKSKTPYSFVPKTFYKTTPITAVVHAGKYLLDDDASYTLPNNQIHLIFKPI